MQHDGSRDSTVRIETSYGLDGPGLESLREQGFPFLQTRRWRFCSPHPLLSIDTGYMTRGKRGCDVNLTTDFHLEPRVKMGGAVPLYAFKAWRETSLPSHNVTTKYVIQLAIQICLHTLYKRHKTKPCSLHSGGSCWTYCPTTTNMTDNFAVFCRPSRCIPGHNHIL